MQLPAVTAETVESVSIGNLTDGQLPVIQYTELLDLLTKLKNTYSEFNPRYQRVGSISELKEWSDWITPRKNSVDRCLSSISLMAHDDLSTALCKLTSGGLLSGAFHYPCDGWMGWHTNYTGYPKDARLYVTYNDRLGSQFLYYRDGQIHVIEEPVGWSIKYFDVSVPFWHAVISKAERYSFGFRYTVPN